MALASSACSLSLSALGRQRLELSTKDAIPESASHTESILIISVVVLQVVLLELLVVERKTVAVSNKIEEQNEVK